MKTTSLPVHNNRVFVVDESKQTIEILIEILTMHNYYSNGETDPYKVVKRILKEKYAIVLIDYLMPEINGLELARLIREEKSLKDLKIVLLTSKILSSNEVKGIFDLDASYIGKPALPSLMINKINELYVEFNEKFNI